MSWVEQFVVKYPELAVFLVISIGYLIGRVKLLGFSLGPVTGSLFAGILIGQFAHVQISAMAKSFLFLPFLFGIGYSVGPQFLQSLKQDGLRPVLLAAPHEPHTALGRLAGAQTMTAGMAAVQDRSGSPVAVLGYTPAVPIGHILLTTWGTVIVGVIAN
jgi:uncharacterized transporter YbjL